MPRINTQLNEALDAVVGDEFKQQLTQDLGTAMLHRATGKQKSQRIVAKARPADIAERERPSEVTREDSRYIRRMCTSSRNSFARL